MLIDFRYDGQPNESKCIAAAKQHAAKSAYGQSTNGKSADAWTTASKHFDDDEGKRWRHCESL